MNARPLWMDEPTHSERLTVEDIIDLLGRHESVLVGNHFWNLTCADGGVRYLQSNNAMYRLGADETLEDALKRAGAI